MKKIILLITLLLCFQGNVNALTCCPTGRVLEIGTYRPIPDVEIWLKVQGVWDLLGFTSNDGQYTGNYRVCYWDMDSYLIKAVKYGYTIGYAYHPGIGSGMNTDIPMPDIFIQFKGCN